MIPDELAGDLAALKNRGFKIESVEKDARIYVVFRQFKLPAGLYNAAAADLLIFTTPHYPQAGFDMFWTDGSLTLRDGRIPGGADYLEEHLGRKWRRFSYHPYDARAWNPSKDDVIGFTEYVIRRLQRGD